MAGNYLKTLTFKLIVVKINNEHNFGPSEHFFYGRNMFLRWFLIKVSTILSHRLEIYIYLVILDSGAWDHGCGPLSIHYLSFIVTVNQRFRYEIIGEHVPTQLRVCFYTIRLSFFSCCMDAFIVISSTLPYWHMFLVLPLNYWFYDLVCSWKKKICIKG